MKTGLQKIQNVRKQVIKNDLPITWNTVDLGQLALDVTHYSKMGLDMMQTNHLVAIPYKKKGWQALFCYIY